LKIYNKKNVLEKSLERIRYLFDEFEDVIVSMSGGKDSTVCFNLCLMVAKEKNRLPLKVMWLDQEAEWQGTVNYMEKIMTMKEVFPFWFQIPMVITNNANLKEKYCYCWEEGKEHLHEKNLISIKENNYGTNRFHDLFKNIIEFHFKNKKACYVVGMRCEESPKRSLTLTSGRKYKDISWCKKINDIHYSFSPIYDWSYVDVWKFINDNCLDYNKVYDAMYSLGISINNMRISSIHHETSIQSLLIMQEIEPKLWEKVSVKINGANSIKHLKSNSFICPKDLPYMFDSWDEYCEYLIDNLVFEKENKIKLIKIKNKYKEKLIDDLIRIELNKTVINTILSNDYDFTKLVNFWIRPEVNDYRRFKEKKYHINQIKNKYIPDEEKGELLEWLRNS